MTEPPDARPLPITRITSARRRGSSRPLVAETPNGARLVKLRGAAQGTGPLVAEIIVHGLATAVGIPVVPWCLVSFAAGVPVADWDDELDDLLRASIGVNLGFDFLDGARDLTAAEARGLDPALLAKVLWLDRLVENPDRTARNPNLLWWAGTPWCIDHGAALWFQYAWPQVTETTPRRQGAGRTVHLFEHDVTPDVLAAVDAALAPRITRTLLHEVVAAVPDTLLSPMLAPMPAPLLDDGSHATADALARRRAAYAAYLWKRLAAPRTWAGATAATDVRPPDARTGAASAGTARPAR